MEEIGPVDYAIVAFPGNRFRGEIAPALADLVENGTIRIIDATFVGKNADGDAVAMELTELDPDVQEALEKLGVVVGGLFNEDDLMTAAEELEPNSSAMLIVWENVWARKVTQAMRDAEASCSTSTGSRTMSCRRPASGRWKKQRKPREESQRCSGDEVRGWFAPRPRPRSSRGLRERSAIARIRSTPSRTNKPTTKRWPPSRWPHHRRSRATRENSSSSPS